MKGEIGAKIREGQTAQNAAKIDPETMIVSTQRQGEGKKEEIKVSTDVKIFENQKEANLAEANAGLATKKAGWAQAAKLAEVEAAKAVAMRVEAELQSEVEKKNALAKTEKLKAELLSQANVEYETKGREANWELYRKQKEVEAVLYEKQKNAEAQKATTDAAFCARQQAADGELYAKKKEAEAIEILAKAQGFYLTTLLKQFEFVKINAQAVNGLQPKISIWNNGANGGVKANSGGPMKDIAGVFSMLPPLLTIVQ
ncbi:hypothetical protein P3X46_010808 [Hevea brasiliensis]|uniref:Flotillin-like n=1 Tax=Hevea brasiliensis TaxID=3981 RepID=A0ABQ9MIT1_HEVBR|nr:hypothetical protein P3X46_010808 [Hevea brasiliensis]